MNKTNIHVSLHEPEIEVRQTAYSHKDRSCTLKLDGKK